MFVFATVLTGQQRLVFVILLGVVAMPLVLIGLSVAASLKVTEAGRPGPLNAALPGRRGVHQCRAVRQPGCYAALAFVIVSGALVTYGVRLAAVNRRAGRPSAS